MFITTLCPCSVFHPEKDQFQGTFPGDSVEGSHGVRVFGIRAQGICHERGIFLPASLAASASREEFIP